MNRFLVVLSALIALVPGALQAQTVRYITDEFEITLRTGESTSHSIVRMIASGTPVEVLQTNPDTGYTKVRVEDKEGYVISRYLMAEASARDRLAQAQKRLAAMELDLKRLRGEKSEADKTIQQVRSEQNNLDAENRKLRLNLTEITRVSENAIQIERERKELQNRLMEQERQLQTLAVENESLKDRTARDWFMVGAGVMLFGILTGWIASRTRWRKRSSWDTL